MKSPWITQGIKQSSKRKERLYNTFLNIIPINERKYNDYKTLFEAIKKRSKTLYFSNLINKYKINIKKTWQAIKEALGKGQVNR